MRERGEESNSFKGTGILLAGGRLCWDRRSENCAELAAAASVCLLRLATRSYLYTQQKCAPVSRKDRSQVFLAVPDVHHHPAAPAQCSPAWRGEGLSTA